MTSLSPSRPYEHGAMTSVRGFVSAGATWNEDVKITFSGIAVPNAEDWEWTFKFKPNREDRNALLTLSTSEGTLAIVQGTDYTTLQIRVSPSLMSAMCGNYYSDLESEDDSGEVNHWSHGIITFNPEP